MAEQGFTTASVAYGLAGAKPIQIAINSEAATRFPYYSLSKPITAAVALRTLNLEETFQGASVRQLLLHTGGWDSSIAGDPVTRNGNTTPCIRLSAGAKQFTPGTRFAYSNVGYCILGRAIETRTGMTYRDATNEILPETRDMGFDPILGPAGGWSGTAEQYFRFASRPLPDLSERVVRHQGLPYSFGWATDGSVATHFGVYPGAFTLVVRRGKFVAVALFSGRPPDDYAAEAKVRAYLLSLENEPPARAD